MIRTITRNMVESSAAMDWIQQFLQPDRLESWKGLLPFAFAFSIVVFFGSIVAVSIVLVRLPADYLNQDETKIRSRRWRPLHVVQVALRSLLGLLLILAGLIMLITPGQGLLTILVGLTLIDFPGKRYLIRSILARPKILKAINKVRIRAKKSPLQPPVDQWHQEPVSSESGQR